MKRKKELKPVPPKTTLPKKKDGPPRLEMTATVFNFRGDLYLSHISSCLLYEGFKLGDEVKIIVERVEKS